MSELLLGGDVNPHACRVRDRFDRDLLITYLGRGRKTWIGSDLLGKVVPG
jgi:hypothetical protein